MSSAKITVKKLRDMKKSGDKIAALTACDFLTSTLLSDTGIDIILVGDSLGMVFQGKDNTLSVTLDDMIYHTRCVARGNKNALLVSDMPFLTYHVSDEDAIRNAGALIQKGCAEAVKLEGGADIAPTVKKLVNAGIPVMGHIGLTPQDILSTGGYFIQGTNEQAALKLIADAKTLQDAGIFALVLECIPASLAHDITQALDVPTIGIGAGKDCDGQILVTYDMIGLYKRIKPRFLKMYTNCYDQASDAITRYKDEVKNGSFPGKEHSY
ncbi:MAG: 3-methyl-2-oxobutanoate hydroxymethyltransferase [Candidatus Auribacterota bacterium]